MAETTIITPTTTTTLQETTITAPIVIDLGRKRRKQIKQLRRGERGKLMDRIEDVLAQLKTEGVVSGKIQPVIVVVREREDDKDRAVSMFRF
jgi:Family of unknown function (DUF6200)